MVVTSLIIAMIWQAIGYYMVMYMASMASIPQSLYESAGLDGAGRITQFFHDNPKENRKTSAPMAIP